MFDRGSEYASGCYFFYFKVISKQVQTRSELKKNSDTKIYMEKSTMDFFFSKIGGQQKLV